MVAGAVDKQLKTQVKAVPNRPHAAAESAFRLLPLAEINQLLNRSSNLQQGDLISTVKSLFWICRASNFFSTLETERVARNTRAIRRRLVVKHDPDR